MVIMGFGFLIGDFLMIFVKLFYDFGGGLKISGTFIEVGLYLYQWSLFQDYDFEGIFG